MPGSGSGSGSDEAPRSPGAKHRRRLWAAATPRGVAAGLAAAVSALSALACVLAPELGAIVWTASRGDPLSKFESPVRTPGRFVGGAGKAPVRVAVVGGGIAGLSAAYTLSRSNAHGQAPSFNVTVLEAGERAGGHSTTINFPTKSGRTYPVDAGYAYNPTMGAYGWLRSFEKFHGIDMDGPLQQRVKVFRANFEDVPSDVNERLDKECDVFMNAVGWVQRNKHTARLLLSPISLRTMLRFLGLSDDFFLLRLYPVIRFVIVSGSKGKMLDATALGGIATFSSKWATCYAGALHGDFDWYTVKGGSQSHIKVFEKELGDRIHTKASVLKARENGNGVWVTWQKGLDAPKTERFDAVVMATPPDISTRIMGSDAPSWLSLPTSEAITVVLHSDTSLMGPHGGDKAGPNMVYVAAEGAEGNYANAALSVLWDSIHGEEVRPRPVLTYNPECLKGDEKLEGEVFRTRFSHIHLPSALSYVRCMAGIRAAHTKANARYFYAGAWAHKWSLSHTGGLQSGHNAAVSIGAVPEQAAFYTGYLHDEEGYAARLRANGGRWDAVDLAKYPK